MDDRKLCSVCSKIPGKVYDEAQGIMVSLYHNKKSGNIGLVIAKENGGVSVDVAYCPWCGKYLRGERNGIN